MLSVLHPLIPNPMYDLLPVLKKGGKAKKKKAKGKAKAKAGDMVMMHKGLPPSGFGGGAGMLGGGSVHRMAGPGMAFASAPATLGGASMAAPPAVARPLSRVEFIGSSDAFYNRGRIKSDDFVVQVNPSDIVPDVTPSKRLIPSKNPNAMPLTDYRTYNQFVFQGETPRLNQIQMKPSSRAVASQPTDGYSMSRLPQVIYQDEHGVGQEAVAEEMGRPIIEEVPQQDGKQEAAAMAAHEPLIRNIPEPPKKGSALYKQVMAAAKLTYPSIQILRSEGFKGYMDWAYQMIDDGIFESYEDLVHQYEGELVPAHRRGGRMSVF